MINSFDDSLSGYEKLHFPFPVKEYNRNISISVHIFMTITPPMSCPQ